MDGLIEGLLSNPFLILIIIGGLMSFFRDKPEEKDQDKGTANRPTSPTRTAERPRTVKRPSKSDPVQHEEHADLDYRSATEHRDEQMDQLRRQLGATSDYSDHQANVSQVKEVSSQTSSHKKIKYKKVKKQMKKNTTRKGLLNGIILSEILGPPRARKPYRNVIQERED